MTDQAAHGSNMSMTYNELLKEARKLGGEKAVGDDSMAKLFIRLVRAANEGVIDQVKDKHGNGIDDARAIYTEFSAMRSKKAIHERTDGGFKAQVSKLRAAVKLGEMTTCDPPDVIDRAQRLLSAAVKAGDKVKAAYAAYIDVARAQIASDQDLSDGEITSCIRKKDAEEPSLEKYLAGEVKKMEKVITGEAGFKCQDQRLLDAFDKVKELYGDVVRDTGPNGVSMQL